MNLKRGKYNIKIQKDTKKKDLNPKSVSVIKMREMNQRKRFIIRKQEI